jgi:hypothetical protein
MLCGDQYGCCHFLLSLSLPQNRVHIHVFISHYFHRIEKTHLKLWAPHMFLNQSHNDLTQVHMSPGSIHPLSDRLPV